MRVFLAAIVGLGMAVSGGLALADPGKDESGKGRERSGSARELRFDQDEARGREDRGRETRSRDDRRESPRRTVREFKEEYDDGRCKVERKLEKSGEYKEEIKCRPGGRRS